MVVRRRDGRPTFDGEKEQGLGSIRTSTDTDLRANGREIISIRHADGTATLTNVAGSPPSRRTAFASEQRYG